MFLLGTGAISWCSKKQNVTSLSTSEAEYIAATLATCQAILLTRLLIGMGINQLGATLIICDNQSTIPIVKNSTHHVLTHPLNLHTFVKKLSCLNSLHLSGTFFFLCRSGSREESLGFFFPTLIIWRSYEA